MGSFLNVVILRIPAGEEIIHTPSHCTSCGHDLTALDLVPILSFLSFSGKCRYCKSPISSQYATIEASIATLFLLSHLAFPLHFVYILSTLLGCQFLIWGIMTTRGYEIPLKIRILSLIPPVFFFLLAALFYQNPGILRFYFKHYIFPSQALYFGALILLLTWAYLFGDWKQSLHCFILPPFYLGFFLSGAILSIALILTILLKGINILAEKVYNEQLEEPADGVRPYPGETVKRVLPYFQNPYFIGFLGHLLTLVGFITWGNLQ